MGVNSPSDMSETFGKFFNARDREGLLDLYVEDGMLTIDGETSARGKTAIGEMIAPLLDGPLKISTKCARSLSEKPSRAAPRFHGLGLGGRRAAMPWHR